MKRVLLAVFDACWLPALLLASCTWLYAPWLHHTHIGSLSLISDYETTAQPYGWLLRLGDGIGAIILLLALWRARSLRARQPCCGRWPLLVCSPALTLFLLMAAHRRAVLGRG